MLSSYSSILFGSVDGWMRLETCNLEKMNGRFGIYISMICVVSKKTLFSHILYVKKFGWQVSLEGITHNGEFVLTWTKQNWHEQNAEKEGMETLRTSKYKHTHKHTQTHYLKLCKYFGMQQLFIHISIYVGILLQIAIACRSYIGMEEGGKKNKG